MGPNEAQLRAALHEGEGESLDAAALISHAVQVRRERRRRVTSIVGAVVVVAVVGLGTAGLVALGRGGDHGAASSVAGGAARSSVAGGNGKAPVSRAAVQPSVATIPVPACPATPMRYRLPTSQNVKEPLFERPVAAMRVCAYRDGAGPSSAALTGADARTLAETLNSSGVLPGTRVKCPANLDVASGTFELLAVDADGTALDPVVITLGCGLSPATNGTALRFLSDVPLRVLKLLPVVPGHVVGSPVR